VPANARQPGAAADPTAVAATAGSITGIAAAKLLPRATRLAWERAFVAFACDEINATFDRIAAVIASDAPFPDSLRRRIDVVVAAASWSDETVVAHVWDLIDEGFERPEDAFGAATILRRLRPDSKDVLDFASAQAANVLAVLEATTRSNGAAAFRAEGTPLLRPR
jgi:hypothetical protein